MRRDRTDFVRRSSLWLLASTMMLGNGAAFAQDAALPEPSETAPESRTAAQEQDTIVVTAQRREENLQDVPIAITAITTKTLDDLQVDKFEDYARLVPSLSFKSGGGGGSPSGPGTSNVYFRGVASGENGNHSSSLPSVRSRPSPARSTSMSSTSPGSRRSPGRRAPSTAPHPRPVRSASSPTSPIRPPLTARPISR